MAFNIMDLFGASALNRLLQPAQTAPAAGFTPNRLAQPFQAGGTAQAGAGVAPAAQAVTAVDPWEGLREVSPGVRDPMTTASVAPQPAPQQRQPFLSDDRRAQLNDFFTGLAMGGTPQESIAYGAKLVAANQGTRKNVNETVKWLQGKGMDEQQAKMLASSPPALNEYLKTLAEGSDPMRALQIQKAQLEIQNLQNPQAKLTDDQREYQAAKDQGFTGTFMDYQVKMKEAGRQQVNIDTGEKLPSGFRWVDSNKRELGVEPIPGGPATQLPGELAARVGMADNWLGSDLPDLKKQVETGALTGPFDRFKAANDSGSPQAALYRKVQSGVEVLSRLLSGAGMTQVEIDEKAARYMPTYTDDATSMGTKLVQLEAELKAARDAALAGRGGPARGEAAPAAADPLGIRQ